MSNDGILSQEEIDALLSRSGELADEEKPDKSPGAEMQLSDVEKDALGEIGNISFGSSATALSTILSQKVEITTPRVRVMSKEELLQEFNTPYVVLEVEFTEGLLGNNLMILKIRDALIIANIMMGGDGQVDENQELTELHLSAVQEAMNQMMGSAATAMASMYNRVVNISPPRARVVNIQQESDQLDLEDWLVQIGFSLRVGNLIDSTIMLLLHLSFAKEMVSLLISGSGGQESKTPQHATDTRPGQQPALVQTPPQSAQGPTYAEQPASMTYMAASSGSGYADPGMVQQGAPAYAAAQAAYGQAAAAYGQGGGSYAQGSYGQMPPQRNDVQIPVQKPEFTPLIQQTAQPEVRNLDLLMDIPLQISVELGRTKKTIKEILELSSGSVIELDKLAGEPVDIYVNHQLIARGEVVVIDENFGVRITTILDPRERLQRL